MEWSGALAEEEPDDPNPRIVTDRPHFAEATATVGLGRVQAETGYSFFRDEEGGTRVQTHSFPETLLRAGFFREWFEFRLGYNYFVEKETFAGQSTTLVARGAREISGRQVSVTTLLKIAREAGLQLQKGRRTDEPRDVPVPKER